MPKKPLQNIRWLLGSLVALLVVAMGVGMSPFGIDGLRGHNHLQETRRMSDSSLPQTEADWQNALTPEQYHVLRRKGTERACTGDYWDTETAGTYVCAGCGHPQRNTHHATSATTVLSINRVRRSGAWGRIAFRRKGHQVNARNTVGCPCWVARRRCSWC